MLDYVNMLRRGIEFDAERAFAIAADAVADLSQAEVLLDIIDQHFEKFLYMTELDTTEAMRGQRTILLESLETNALRYQTELWVRQDIQKAMQSRRGGWRQHLSAAL